MSAVTGDAVREAVAHLATTPMRIPLTEWSRLSGVILAASHVVDAEAARIEALGSIRVFAQDCIENGHDRGQLGNLYAIRDLCDAALASATDSKAGQS